MTWKEAHLKERFFQKTSIIFIVFILFYGIQGILSIFYDYFPSIVDIFAVTGVLTVFFIMHLLSKFHSTVPLSFGIGFLFHIAGLYNIIPYNEYYTGNLYGLPILNYHYDLIVHSVGFGLLAIAFCSILYPHLKKGFKNHLLIFSLLLFFMLGLGAFNEITEYVGYDVFGYGESFLEFGKGDSSPNEGPWENTSLDLIANLVGGMTAIGSFLLIKKYQEAKS